MGIFGNSPEVHSIRESAAPQHLTGNELHEAIRSVVEQRGNAAFTEATQCRVDTSSQLLPALEISSVDQAAAIRAKKDEMAVYAAQEHARPQNLEGGVRGLIERTNTDNNRDSLTREEIKTRLGSKELADGDAAALKALLQNFDEIDTNGNGRINRNEINKREQNAREAQLVQERLAQWKRLVANRRQDLDRNNDGNITEGEVGDARNTESLFNDSERDLLKWVHSNWD